MQRRANVHIRWCIDMFMEWSLQCSGRFSFLQFDLAYHMQYEIMCKRKKSEMQSASLQLFLLVFTMIGLQRDVLQTIIINLLQL